MENATNWVVYMKGSARRAERQGEEAASTDDATGLLESNQVEGRSREQTITSLTSTLCDVVC